MRDANRTRAARLDCDAAQTCERLFDAATAFAVLARWPLSARFTRLADGTGCRHWLTALFALAKRHVGQRGTRGVGSNARNAAKLTVGCFRRAQLTRRETRALNPACNREFCFRFLRILVVLCERTGRRMVQCCYCSIRPVRNCPSTWSNRHRTRRRACSANTNCSRG